EERTVLSPTTTTLTASVNPATVGQPITFTATVTGGDFTPPGGSVSFIDGTATLATVDVTVFFNQAQFTTVLAPGNHSITAVYTANSILKAVGNDLLTYTNDASTSNVVSEVVPPPVVPPPVVPPPVVPPPVVSPRPIVAALVTRGVGAAR